MFGSAGCHSVGSKRGQHPPPSSVDRRVISGNCTHGPLNLHVGCSNTESANDESSRCFEVNRHRILRGKEIKLLCCCTLIYDVGRVDFAAQRLRAETFFFPILQYPHSLFVLRVSLSIQPVWVRDRPSLCVPARRKAGKMKPTTSSVLVCWVSSLNMARSQTNCQQAFSLTVGNVTLANGQIARGAVAGVGTPSQPMAFLPQM